MWSLGCVLFELITGQKAFSSDFAIFQYASSRVPPPSLATALDEDRSGLLWTFYVHDLLQIDFHVRPSAKKLKSHYQIPSFLSSCNAPPHGYLKGLRGGIRETFNTALTLSVEKGRMDIVEAVARLNVDINVRDGQGHTSLEVALKRQDVQMVELLKQAGADTTRLILDAVASGDTTTLRLLRNEFDEGVITSAPTNGDQDLAGEPITISPYAAEIKPGTERTRVRVEVGGRGMTWVEAVLGGHTRPAIHLIDANRDVKDEYGLSPLQLAALNGNMEIVRFLSPKTSNLATVMDTDWKSRYEEAWNLYGYVERGVIERIPSHLRRMGADWFALFRSDLLGEPIVELEKTIENGFAEAPDIISWSPNGTYVAICAWKDSTARIFEALSWEVLGKFEHDEGFREYYEVGIYACCFSPTNDRFATSAKTTIMIWNLNTWQLEKVIDISQPPDLGLDIIQFSQSGERLIGTQVCGRVYMWDVGTRSLLRKREIGTFNDTFRMALSCDGKYTARVIINYDKEVVRIWGIEGGGESDDMDVQGSEGVGELHFTRTGDLIVAVRNELRVFKVWPSSAEGFTDSKMKDRYIHTKLDAKFVGPKNKTLWAISSSEDGVWIITMWGEGLVILWNRYQVAPSPTMVVNTGNGARQISISCSIRVGSKYFIVTASGGRKVEVWKYSL
jgi:WD40 repeat protein